MTVLCVFKKVGERLNKEIEDFFNKENIKKKKKIKNVL